MKRLAIAAAALAVAGAAQAASLTEAFTQPFDALAPRYAEAFRRGGGLFRQAWVIGPSVDHPDETGLGPLYNRLSCIACHVKNGRGAAPDSENGVPRDMVVRLSVPGRDAHGGPPPHPAYGGQFNSEGVPGVDGEGRVTIGYDSVEVELSGGERIELRRPHLSFRHLAYGPLGEETKTSLRNAPPVFGLGLLDAVSESEILSGVADGRGRANYVWDVESGKSVLGRFGLKANQPSLRQQVAGAFVEDIGITSDLFPHESCTATQSACLASAGHENKPELTHAQLDAVVDYIRALSPPPRRDTDNPGIKQGEALFAQLACDACHRPTLRIGRFDPASALSGAEIHPYTDLLLHDMGEGLADGRDDFDAGPRDWRTAPLWGLGLAGKGGDGANFLHDGRARTLAEAILWHGGDARAAADAFRALAKDERNALLAFLQSL